MSNFFGIGSDSGSFFNSYFGATSDSNSSSGSLSVGDYAMIKSGGYKKLLKKYYAENGTDTEKTANTIKTSAAADSTKSLLAVKDAAKSVTEAADKLKTTDYDSVSREDLLKTVKSFVDKYNELVGDLDNMESVAVLQNGVWMTNQMKANKNVLADMGITIDKGNKLTIDEKKFNSADIGNIKTAFKGNNSIVGSVSQRAGQIYTLAGTQALVNARTSSYSNSGSYNTLKTSQLFNSLL